MAVRVEIQSEIVALGKPARVLVYENGNIVAEVVAEVDLQPGADGGYYHSVTLRRAIPKERLQGLQSLSFNHSTQGGRI